MRKHKPIVGVSAGLFALALGAVVAPPAIAAESTPDPIDSVERAAPGVMSAVDEQALKELPADSSERIDVVATNGETISISLPASERAAAAARSAEGILVYDNGDGSLTIPVPQESGGVAIHTVSLDSSAPTTYSYDLDIPAGAQLVQVEEGGVAILDEKGAYLAAIANPWAKDAAGNEVGTDFILDGTTLIQTVEHNVEGVEYPVVADPYLGVALHGSTWWSGSGSSRKASLNTTPQRAVAWAAGQAYNAGWPEAKAKMGSELNKETYRQQYKCHADNAPMVLAGGVFGYGNTWDLEYSRGTNSNYGDVWGHQCNW